MRIAFLTPAWPGNTTPNGIVTAVRNISEGIVSSGNEVVILAAEANESSTSAVEVVPLPERAWRFREKLLARIGFEDAVYTVFTDRIIDAVKSSKPDVVVMEETQGWALRVVQSVDVPVIVTLHGPWLLHKNLQGKNDIRADARRERREKYALLQCAAITAPSRHVLAAVQEKLNLPESKPQKVIYNPILRPKKNLRDLQTEAEKNRILFVGRYDRHKGGDTLIDGFLQLLTTHSQAELTFCGPDLGIRQKSGFVEYLTERVLALPEDKRQKIEIRGSCSVEQISELRQRHGIAVVTSRYEVFGYTILEAMASGAALVATSVGGPAEFLIDGKNALIIPPDDPQALANAFSRLLDNPKLAENLSAAAFQKALDFAPDRIARQFAELASEIISN